MAKTNMVEREKRRLKTVQKYAKLDSGEEPRVRRD